MLCHLTGRRPGAILDLANYELELEDRFEGPVLDRRLWIPYYLPHWSSRAGSAARYAMASGTLRLFIEHDQGLWSPEFAGHLRVCRSRPVYSRDPSEAQSANTASARA